jgi:hypothetical protein
VPDVSVVGTKSDEALNPLEFAVLGVASVPLSAATIKDLFLVNVEASIIASFRVLKVTFLDCD